jgi:hypothetical protein
MILVALAGGAFWLLRDDAGSRTAPFSKVEQVAPEPNARMNTGSQTAAAPSGEIAISQQQVGSTPAALVVKSEEDDPTEDPAKMFKADAHGDLVLADRTRLNIEKVLWLYAPSEQQEKLAVMEQSLSPKAFRQLMDLLDRYKTFVAAAKQSYPPDRAPATVEEAIAQNEGLSSLRKSHFGEEAAEAMFGREERVNRQLLEFMRLEQHQGLTMEEKAERAQEMLRQSPDLRAVYEKR